MTADDPKMSDPGVGAPAMAGGDRQGETPEQAIERLTAELAEKTAEAARNWDLYLRERAEMENFKKRMQREKSRGAALRGRAAGARPAAGDRQPRARRRARRLRAAMANRCSKACGWSCGSALDVLERHGVTRVEATGGPFDPSRHEAVVQVPDAAARAQPGRRAVRARLHPARSAAAPRQGQCFHQTAG